MTGRRVLRDHPTDHLTDSVERGSGTVITLGIIGVIASLLIALTLVGTAVVAAHRARAAADLASIGAARVVLLGGDASRACREATAVARANDARMVGCSLDAADVTVETSVELPRVLRALGHADARSLAKAGPR